MNGNWMSIILALSAGLMGSFQGSINALIGKNAGQYSMITGVSLIQAIVAGLILLRGGWHAFTAIFSPWMIVAGIMGVIMMFSVSSAIGSVGTLTVFVLVITGQIVGSTLIDHFGLFGAARPITPQKIGSILMIIMGVFWLVKAA